MDIASERKLCGLQQVSMGMILHPNLFHATELVLRG